VLFITGCSYRRGIPPVSMVKLVTLLTSAVFTDEEYFLSAFGTMFVISIIYLYELTLSAGRGRVSDRVAKGVFCIRTGVSNCPKSELLVSGIDYKG
jgi:hypothetical protein